MEAGQRLGELTERLKRPTPWKGKRMRALHPFAAPDSALWEAVSRGEWDGARIPEPGAAIKPASSPEEKRRRSARVSRQLRCWRPSPH
jgi:hypothetical protein